VKSIPQLCQLQSLKFLDLSSNGLVSLPHEMGFLRQVETLLLEANNFASDSVLFSAEDF